MQDSNTEEFPTITTHHNPAHATQIGTKVLISDILASIILLALSTMIGTSTSFACLVQASVCSSTSQLSSHSIAMQFSQRPDIKYDSDRHTTTATTLELCELAVKQGVRPRLSDSSDGSLRVCHREIQALPQFQAEIPRPHLCLHATGSQHCEVWLDEHPDVTKKNTKSMDRHPLSP